MIKIIFLLFSLVLNTQANTMPTATFQNQLMLQEYAVNAMITLQNQKIENLESQLKVVEKYQDLREDVLNNQENSINWWLSVIGVLLALFGIFGVFVAKDKIKEFEQRNQDAKTKLDEIETYRATAEQDAAEISKLSKLSKKAFQSLINPEVKVSQKTLTEVKEYGTKLEKMIVKARELEANNEIEQAILLWEEIAAIAKYENNKKQQMSSYFYLGFLYARYKIDYEKSIKFSQKAIEIKSNYHEAYNNMGVAYSDLGGTENLAKAIKAYQKAIEIKSNYYEAYYNMGVSYRRLGGTGNLAKAIKAYQDAIEIKPDKHEAYNNMGVAYRRLGGTENLAKAIKAYQKAIEIKPDKHEAYNNMGVAYAGLGGTENLTKAIKAYQNAIEIKPDKHEAYNNMGVAYSDLGGTGNLTKAIKAYQNAIEIKSNYHGAYYNMGNAYDSLEQFDDAIKNYEIAISLNPNIGKEIDQKDWDILTKRIATLDNQAIKQKYQAILSKLKGE